MVAAMIARAGHMRAGAKAPICVTYSSENRAVVPRASTFDTTSPTRASAAMLRLASSPALKSRKNVAGKLRMRIMNAEDSWVEVFVRMRLTAISREAVII